MPTFESGQAEPETVPISPPAQPPETNKEDPGKQGLTAKLQDAASDSLNQQLLLLVILLGFYCAPTIIVFFVCVYDLLTAKVIEGMMVTAVSAVASDPKSYTNTITGMLLPVASALTAVNYRSILVRGWSATLFLLPLFAVFACITNALMFSIGTSSLLENRDVISQFFLSSAGSLSIYVMMLVGLKMGENTPKAQGTQ